MRPLRVLVKIVLIVVGALMVLGGGFCAITNVVFLPNLPSSDISLFGVLFGISVAVLVVGALLLKLSVGRKFSDPGDINR